MKRAGPCRRAGLAFLLLALAIAAGCGKSEPKPVTTQVAAKVNGEEITVHQVNNILARTPNIAPGNADRVKREILDRLIDQQLARQQAIHKKLDLTPAVMQGLEAARSEILARAYLERVGAEHPKPTAEEIKQYYTEHPELFSQRRVYSLEEIAFVAKEDVAVVLRERMVKAKSMQEIAEWLDAQGIKFVPNRGVRAAEQLPLETLPKVQSMKDGDIQLFSTPDGGHQVIRVVASRADPVDEETATPRILQFLNNRRSSDAIVRDLKQLRGQAKIDYVGEFAGGVAEAEAQSKVQAVAKAKDEKEAQARAEASSNARAAEEAKMRLEAGRKAAPSSKPAPLPSQSVEKGVGGLN